MEALRPPKLTIAIPLHGAERWLEGIAANVSKAPEWSRVVISDASGLDDSAERLSALLATDPGVSVVKRPRHLDWVSHCNLLLAEAETEFFCWLPQDDLVLSDDYFERLVDLLRDDPEAVLALPNVHAVFGRGRIRRRPEFISRLVGSTGSAPLRFRAAEPEALFGSRRLGIPWRGIFRRERSRPMPPIEVGTSSDVVWIFSMLLSGDLVEATDALYLKRWHRESATYRMGGSSLESIGPLLRTEMEARHLNSDFDRERILADSERYIELRRESQPREPGIAGKALRRLANEPLPFFE